MDGLLHLVQRGGVPTSCYLMWHYSCRWTLKGYGQNLKAKLKAWTFDAKARAKVKALRPEQKVRYAIRLAAWQDR